MAFGLIKQIRHAVNYLNPEEVRHDAEHPLAVSLHAPTPEALGAYHRAEIEKWWPLIKAAGIKAE